MLLTRLLLTFALAATVSGCLRPLYGDQALNGRSSIVDNMRSIEVDPVKVSVGNRLPRVGGEVRNRIIFALTGGGAPNTSNYRLVVNMSSQNLQVVSDVISGRPDGMNYGIDISYTLIEIGTGKSVVNGSTFSRVFYNVPGQQQRFAGERALRDAENRAAEVIADAIHSRLASYFAAGT